ncbi:hypothetical protein AC1031_004821 [Aphanomyces cochlioides]|nr:hypothetical protein AC1031_004821 [Aphanomyces cochlioides]
MIGLPDSTESLEFDVVQQQPIAVDARKSFSIHRQGKSTRDTWIEGEAKNKQELEDVDTKIKEHEEDIITLTIFLREWTVSIPQPSGGAHSRQRLKDQVIVLVSELKEAKAEVTVNNIANA